MGSEKGNFDPLRQTLRGARAGPPVERAGFGMLASFAVTIPVSRTINYVRERRRRAPAVRSIIRRIVSGPQTSSPRVHHFAPGAGAAFAAGGAAILTQPRRAFRLSVPFGIGVALALDEVEVLLERDNPYWGSERFALTQAAVAGVGAAALVIRFRARGAAQTPPS